MNIWLLFCLYRNKDKINLQYMITITKLKKEEKCRKYRIFMT